MFANLPLIGGRISIALNEILRLMRDNLPADIAYVNAQCGYAQGIPIPASYYMAPERVKPDDINYIIVGASVPMRSEGAGQFKAVSTVELVTVNQTITDREQSMDQWDRAWIMAALLYRTLGGWTNPAGQTVWSNLRPMAIAEAGQNNDDYHAISITYEMTQYPIQGNLWTPDQ